MAWLGGIDGAFRMQTPKRRAQLVALWREMHAPAQKSGKRPQPEPEALPPADFVERMRKAYGG